MYLKYKISKATITRTIVNAIALLNIILIIFNKTPLDLDENLIYTIISGLAAIITNLISWWKNNSFSQPALKADEYLKMIKGDEIEKAN